MEKGRGMIYTENIQVDEQGRLTECPVCKNTEFSDSAQYCRICGMSRRNLCIQEDGSCQHYNPANARFCEYCGAKTIFFQYNLLLPWNAVAREQKKEAPPVEEEELPF